jgi:anti-anti-sigma regulatory factor
MYQLEFDSDHRVLRLSYSGRVGLDEARRCRSDLEVLLSSVKPGFSLLTDLSGLEEMDYACVDEIRAAMDQFQEHGVAHVVRVIPDRSKDIGFTVMSYFHYGREVSVQTVDSLADGLKAVSA